MSSLQHADVEAFATPSRVAAQRIFVHCLDDARRDLIALWLERGGCEVAFGLPSGHDALGRSQSDVLVTDCFGPGLPGEIVIGELKADHPNLRIVVLGCGNGSQLAQLSLARVAGADATLAFPFTRAALLEHVRRAVELPGKPGHGERSV